MARALLASDGIAINMQDHVCIRSHALHIQCPCNTQAGDSALHKAAAVDCVPLFTLLAAAGANVALTNSVSSAAMPDRQLSIREAIT